MKRIIFAICVLLTLSFVGCGDQQQSKSSNLSEKDKATVKAVVAAEIMKKGREEGNEDIVRKGRQLSHEAVVEFMKAHEKD